MSQMRRRAAQRIRRTLGLVLLLALILWAACARIRPLSGGDPDQSPPVFVAASPADSSAGIGRTQVFQFQFDERLDRNAVNTAIRTYPHLARKEIEVKGGRVTLTFPDSLPADTTFVIVIGKSLADQKPRDNKLQKELWLMYSTGSAIRGGAIFGRVSLKGMPEPDGVVQFEPVPADTSRGSDRPRYPAAATDEEGLFRMLGIPAGQAFLLRGYADRNHNRLADIDELQWVLPETLILADAEIRRGLEWNLIDPNEPANIEGVVINRSGVEGRVAIGLKQIIELQPGDSSLASRPDARRQGDAASGGKRRGRLGSQAAPIGAPDLQPPAQVVGDSLFPGWVALPEQDRQESGYESAYAVLDSTGFQKSQWRIKYATPRGDYRLQVAPGRHWIVAFVDVSRDSMPGLYVTQDSTLKNWEPFWIGDTLYVAPGDDYRARSIDVESTAPPGN